ncbi:hypothetical protein QSJ18_19565, partial [Gordonia sp. ABSL1-1]|uniref:hypothetical protein n=1 Tax=Gordonia sp. ABSL1-1 TaxID=3053923 RepID=UPI00257368DF
MQQLTLGRHSSRGMLVMQVDAEEMLAVAGQFDARKTTLEVSPIRDLISAETKVYVNLDINYGITRVDKAVSWIVKLRDARFGFWSEALQKSAKGYRDTDEIASIRIDHIPSLPAS